MGLKLEEMSVEDLVSRILNRTSVGLKLELFARDLSDAVQPQSNQRGIETEIYRERDPLDAYASIEPAWD